MGQKIGGLKRISVDGQVLRPKGNWTYNLGRPNRSAVVGPDGTHGFKEEPQVPFIEGAISLTSDINPEVLMALTNSTVVAETDDDNVIVLRSAWFAGEGNVTTEEGELAVRFEGLDGELVR